MTQIAEIKPRRFRLKSMVLARIFAEITVLLILVVLPAVLAITGHLQKAPITGKVVFLALSLIAALILPAYAFITFMVKIDRDGLTAISVAKRQYCHWPSMKRLSRRSNWNWVRYIIEHSGGELTFPIWLVDCNDLIEIIRDKLPKGSGAASPFRKFSQDKISLLFQCMQAALGVGLVVVFWFFFGELVHSTTTNQMDLTIVLGFCLVITMLFLWRSTVVVLMPKSIELTPSGIVVNTMLFERRIVWQGVNKVVPSYPMLPEGFMLKTDKGSFLIGNGMDSADELVSNLKDKIARQTPDTTNGAVPAQHMPPEQTDFTPDTVKSLETESAAEPVSTPEATTDVPPEPEKKQPSGKKADRRFRRKKNR